MRVQMLGLCRFSYLGGRGFQVAHDSIEERRAFLYDPERMARRWFWFEHVALPGWLAQTDPDFTLVVMTGPDLPDPWLSRLRELAQILPQMRLALVPPIEAHLDACLAAVAPHVDPAADVIGHFRHDDDDAVAIDYIAQARRDFGHVRGLWRRKMRLCCDYSRGLVLKGTARGVEVEPWVVYNTGIAQPIFLEPGANRTALHFQHWKIGLSMPNVSLAEKVMFARFLHHDNDSGAIGQGYRWPAEGVDWQALLAQRFRIDLPTLHEGARRFGKPGADRPRWGA
ncbi:MAG: putative rhamnosyl transferase [Paracoccus sp. (in: a-proteobacteria)]|uniref:putative rhamnosyl transferase n=1 Tax=Paracoccus sp. TaxID=267 RepID=UPI0039E4DA1D